MKTFITSLHIKSTLIFFSIISNYVNQIILSIIEIVDNFDIFNNFIINNINININHNNINIIIYFNQFTFLQSFSSKIISFIMFDD